MPPKKASPKTPKKRPKPQPIALNSSKFRALQRTWYKKLKDAGFKDLESFGGHAYEAAPLLQGASLRNIADGYKPETLHYYRLWSCFYMHNTKNLSPRARLIVRLYSEGKTYRHIIEVHNERFKPLNLSLEPLHRFLKHYEKRVFKWNKTSLNGLDYESDI